MFAELGFYGRIRYFVCQQRKDKIQKIIRGKRITGTDTRVRQALVYGCSRTNELTGEELFSTKKKMLKDEFIKREIDEAIERVVELGYLKKT